MQVGWPQSIACWLCFLLFTVSGLPTSAKVAGGQCACSVGCTSCTGLGGAVAGTKCNACASDPGQGFVLQQGSCGESASVPPGSGGCENGHTGNFRTNWHVIITCFSILTTGRRLGACSNPGSLQACAAAAAAAACHLFIYLPTPCCGNSTLCT